MRSFRARESLVEAFNPLEVGRSGYQTGIDRFQQTADESKNLIRELTLIVPNRRFSRLLINKVSELEQVQAEPITHKGRKK
jgi:hypothetical protein